MRPSERAMSAGNLNLDGPVGRLEAILDEPPAPLFVAAVAHPHPLYGGTMHNPVVVEIARCLGARRAAALRFNFRGVGGSEGEHDRGRGEVEDLETAVAELGRRHPDLPLLLAGYSFGARISLERLRSHAAPPAAGILAVAPPLTLEALDFVARSGVPVAVVYGELDTLTPAGALERIADRWPNLVALECVAAVGHDLGTAGATGGGLLRPALERALDSLLTASS